VGFGELQVGLGGLLGWIYGFWGFLSFFGFDPVLFGALFDVFWGLRSVLVGFLLVTMVKKCKLWVLENIRKVYGDFRDGFMVFGFSSVFWVWSCSFLGCFWRVLTSPLGFRWVLVSCKYKWEWIVCFGEDQVSFGSFSWEFLSFCCFFFWFSSCLGCFWRVLASLLCCSWVLVGHHSEKV